MGFVVSHLHTRSVARRVLARVLMLMMEQSIIAHYQVRFPNEKMSIEGCDDPN